MLVDKADGSWHPSAFFFVLKVILEVLIWNDLERLLS